VGGFVFRGGRWRACCDTNGRSGRGLAVTALCGALTGFTGLIVWLEYLRRSPEVREVLAVTEDGSPDTTEILVPEQDLDTGTHPQ
jgi:hypothetical protein